ncbi:MAG: ATP--guanido phosphotransferase [Clostridia bacterium]|nr:ATP--guanido phosphotransferase [Clostridia bacterium]
MNKDIDTVISTRVRFARNLKDYPFTSRLDPTSCKEIIEKTEGVLKGFEKIDFTDMDPVTATSYAERHVVSSEFSNSKLPRALLEKGDTRVMVCEEDHIRLQVIKQGFVLDEAYAEACSTDDKLLSELRIAYDEHLGFLTHCPTNLGNGMRASVMMFLPGLAMTGELKAIISQLPKLGLTIRGMYGEGSRSGGFIYQISNAESLGSSEENILCKLKDTVTQIIIRERLARDRIKSSGETAYDPLSRAYGILKYAYSVTSEEFIDLYARVRLGVYLGIIEGVSYEALDELFCSVMPCTLSMGEQLSPAERDIKRAQIIKTVLG